MTAKKVVGADVSVDFFVDQFKIVHDRLDETDKRLEKLIKLEETAQKSREETLRLLNEFMKANAIAARVDDHGDRIRRIERKLGIVK